MSAMTVDQIAELAKKELDAAEAAVENAKRLLQEGAFPCALRMPRGLVPARDRGEQCAGCAMCMTCRT